MAHGPSQAVFGLGRPVDQAGILDENEDNDLAGILGDDANDGVIDAGALATGSVGTAEIAALAVAEGDIAAGAVTKTKLAGQFIKVALADGTASATDVTVTGMAVGDVLVSVLSFATAASIATVADRTAEYTVQAGGLDKAAGTDETNNQLVIIYQDLT